ncbi:MAG: hypothetical protein EOM63_04540 [Clostridia bacterium]|nr:hypothetical protein [Clostridia bacterium]
MNTILLDVRCGDDGVSAFSREVLFRTAAEWVIDALPSTACGTIYHAHAADAPVLPGTQEFDGAQLTGEVLVIGAPAPALTERGYLALLEMRAQQGGDAALLRAPYGNGKSGALLAIVCDAAALCEPFDTIDALATRIGGQQYTLLAESDVAPVLDGMDAYRVQKQLAEGICFGHIARGVKIFAPDTTYIAPDAVIGAGTTILPGTLVRGGCTIGAGCVIGPNTILEKAVVGDETTVNTSQIYESKVGAHATVGPFAYIRPGCVVGDHTRIGDFVELKKTTIGNGTKVSHLTYLGDAEVGERVNFGCGTVIVNYDGYTKSKTVIGDDCFIGCNTNLVAPVTLGDRVFTAAGATVTSDVPAGALTVARARQRDIPGWNDKRRAAHGQSHGPIDKE